MPPERLIELIEVGETQMATTLAQGIRRSDAVLDVAVTNEEITIETTHFNGIHEVIQDGDGRVSFNDQGTYSVKSNHVDFHFKFRALRDSTIHQINTSLKEMELTNKSRNTPNTVQLNQSESSSRPSEKNEGGRYGTVASLIRKSIRSE